MTQYEKDCMYCKEKITMSDETGKWLPYNKDGSAHDCRINGNGKVKEKKQEITLEMVQRKLESIGITIDMDKSMGQ